jgi:hypothetical protein
MAFAAATFPVALMALGTAPGRLGWVRWPLLALWLVLAGSWAVLLAARGEGDLGPLPLGTAVMLFIMVPVPFALACWIYIAGFDRLGLRSEDLERLRRLRLPREER